MLWVSLLVSSPFVRGRQPARSLFALRCRSKLTARFFRVSYFRKAHIWVWEIEFSFILLLTFADLSLLYGIYKIKSETSTLADPILHNARNGHHPLGNLHSARKQSSFWGRSGGGWERRALAFRGHKSSMEFSLLFKDAFSSSSHMICGAWLSCLQCQIPFWRSWAFCSSSGRYRLKSVSIAVQCVVMRPLMLIHCKA